MLPLALWTQLHFLSIFPSYFRKLKFGSEQAETRCPQHFILKSLCFVGSDPSAKFSSLMPRL